MTLETKEFAIGDTVTLRLRTAPEPPDGPKPANKLNFAKWIIFIDGVPLKGAKSPALFPPAEPDGARKLHFRLDRETSETAWTELLRPRTWQETERQVRISVGPEDGAAVLEAPEPGTLVLLSGWRFAGALIAVAAIIGILIIGARRGMLDASPGMLSLGRLQMAWWFVIVLCSYIYLGIRTGDFFGTIPGSALTLLGISAATALAAHAVDSEKTRREAETLKRKEALAEETRTLREAVARATPAETPILAARLANAEAELGRAQAAAVPAVAEAPRTRRLDDLFRENDALSLHRIQIAVWTVLLGLVFCFTVAKLLKMPEFDATLLALMGISATTYVGFKYPSGT